MVELTPTQTEPIFDILAHVFPEKSQFAEFLSNDLGKGLIHYSDSTDPLRVAYFRLLQGAETEGWIGELIARMSSQFPQNPEIAQLTSPLDPSVFPASLDCYVSYAWGDDDSVQPGELSGYHLAAVAVGGGISIQG